MAGLRTAISFERIQNPELQSALIRLLIWLFSAVYVGFGAASGYYRVDNAYYLSIFGIYLVLFIGLLLSILKRPNWPRRSFVSLMVDICAVSFAIFLTEEAISPFYLLYIWMFISYGTRYGALHLALASLMSVLAYSLVLLQLHEWQRHTYEAVFFLLLLILLPFYQFTLLRQLHAARREAERANQAKSDFLATMTHELRTPLSSLIGMSRLLRGTRLGPEQQDYVDSIDTSAQMLQALIGDVLDLSKIEANKLQLESVPFDLRQAALEVSRAFGAQALDKDLELICRVAPELPDKLIGDPLRMRQILFNLIGNAIKFTEKGEVVISLRAETARPELPVEHICLEVQDTGIGIPRDKLARVFGEFWQADASTSRHFGGTGLGTTISRDLCRLMGGWIGVDSELGRGSSFCVRLPLPSAETARSKAADSSLLTGRGVLIFDANRTSREWISTVCSSFGMQCRCLDNYDVPRHPSALLDVDLALVADTPFGEDLPDIGVRLSGIPILFLTYNSRHSGVSVEHCLTKPFLPWQLKQRLISLLGVAESGSDAHRAVEPAPSGGQRPSLRVLVAEDNAIAAKVISTFLRQLGHQVTLTKDGVESLARTAGQSFDIAFVDLRMPKLDGMAFTRAQRIREKGGQRLPIIALSANMAEDMGRQTLEAGMDGFLVKPADPEQLDAVIGRFCPIAVSLQSP